MQSHFFRPPKVNGSLKPLMEKMKNRCSPKENDCTMLSDMKKAMLADLNKRYQDKAVKDMLSIGNILDPRFRQTASQLDKDLLLATTIALNQETYKETRTEIPATQSQLITKLSRFECPTASKAKLSTSGTSTDKTTNVVAETQNIDDDDDDDDDEVDDIVSEIFEVKTDSQLDIQRNLDEKVADEIVVYFSYPAIHKDEKEKFDAIHWWKVHHTSMPLLSKTFKAYFCIPATSVPSERCFSVAGNVVTKKRSRLSYKQVDLLTFLRTNMKYIPKDTRIHYFEEFNTDVDSE